MISFPNVRRLAAVDMHGAHGTSLRRTVIVSEFVLGAVAGTPLGILLATRASALGWLLLGIWIAGICLNYVPLALHALSLAGRGRLESELRGADISQELRHYTKAQLWIFVPLLFVVLAPLQRASG